MHVLDDDGNELPVGEPGTLWFEGRLGFEYRNDPAKTAEAVNAVGYTTVGDIGYVDDEGYLYLTDRKALMIISGGVNIYPQETENVLVTHPKVTDVAVIGVPDDDLGEQVKAVVQPADWSRRRPRARARAASSTAARTSRTTSARAPSTSSASCRASTPASSTRASCAPATGRRRDCSRGVGKVAAWPIG